MEVTYTLDPGPAERFGPVAIEGLQGSIPHTSRGASAGSVARSMMRARSKRPGAR